MTSPNHKFDLAQKRKPKKHKIQNKSTKSKRKAQKSKPKKLKSLNNGMSKSKHLCRGCLNSWNKNWTNASKNESSKSKVNRMRVLGAGVVESCVFQHQSQSLGVWCDGLDRPVANNFKRWSVEQLKGACSCYFM